MKMFLYRFVWACKSIPEVILSLFQDGTKEDGIESYFERNEFLDPILKVIFKAAGERRIILASFDPDICIMWVNHT